MQRTFVTRVKMGAMICAVGNTAFCLSATAAGPQIASAGSPGRVIKPAEVAAPGQDKTEPDDPTETADGWGHPNVVDADEAPFGTSLGGWAAAWWQWALSFPAEHSPLFDDTCANADLGQSGPVYFLAGAFSTYPVSRNITVPAGKALFFPVVNSEYDNFTCFDPNTELTVLEMRELIGGGLDGALNLSCKVNGHSVGNIKRNFRVTTPSMSLIPTADGLCTDEPAGVPIPAVADGYYVMLKNLHSGNYTIRFGGDVPDFGVHQDITYHVHVVNGN